VTPFTYILRGFWNTSIFSYVNSPRAPYTDIIEGLLVHLHVYGNSLRVTVTLYIKELYSKFRYSPISGEVIIPYKCNVILAHTNNCWVWLL